jgi:tetratricopeptide (TPR) repeat protein
VAVELYERILRLFGSSPKDLRIQAVTQNPDLWLDVARLWAEEDTSRSLKYYRDAFRLREDRGLPPFPQLLNNIGCLEFAKGRLEAAENTFGSALTAARDIEQSGAGTADSVGATTITYNLGVVYESQGHKDKATRVYEAMVLARHPEWVEGERVSNRACADWPISEHKVDQRVSQQKHVLPLSAWLPRSLTRRTIY